MRLDTYLVQRGVAQSRERAKERIFQGDVCVDGKTILKPSYNVLFGSNVQISGDGLKWVSRAGLKLEHALNEWDINVEGRSCLDIGASTGGFTEVLLSRGASKVFAVDVGREQLHEKLREDARVVNMEALHIKDLERSMIDASIEIVVVDVSFISLMHVLQKAYEFLETDGVLVALVKPQFEVGKDKIKKGVVTNEAVRKEALKRIESEVVSLGFVLDGTVESPITGGDGNVEFLLYAHKRM